MLIAEGVDYAALDAKGEENWTEDERISTLGRPRLGDVTKIQIRIRESKEFKVRFFQDLTNDFQTHIFQPIFYQTYIFYHTHILANPYFIKHIFFFKPMLLTYVQYFVQLNKILDIGQQHGFAKKPASSDLHFHRNLK